MSVGNIKIVLEVKDGDFHVKMTKAGKAVKEFGRDLSSTANSVKRMERSVTGFIPKIRDIFVTVSMAKGAIQNMRQALFGWQSVIVTSNAEIERMTMLMRGLSQETDLAAKQLQAASDVKFVFDLGKRAPFEVKTLTDSFVKFRSVGLDPTNGSLQSLTDAVASFGGNSHIMHRASVAIQQMAGKGVISMEELRQQLGEAVPNAMRVMAQSVGLSIKDLVDQISKGGVQSEEALGKMFKEFEMQMGGSADRMMTTFSGMSQRLVTEWELFKISIGNAGYFDEVKDALSDVVDLLGSDRAKYFGKNLGEALAVGVREGRALVEAIAENWDWIARVSKAVLILAGGAVLGKLVASVGLFGVRAVAAFAAAHKAIVTANAGVTALNLGMIRAQVSALTLGTAIRGAGVALSVAGGPIGITIGLIAALAYAFWDTGEAAMDAAEAITDSFGATASKKNLELLREDIKQTGDDIERLQRKLKNSHFATSEFKMYLKGEISRMMSKQATLLSAEQTGLDAVAERAVNGYTRQAETVLRKARESSQAAYNKVINEAHKELTRETIDKNQYFDIMSDETKRKFKADIDSAVAMANKAEREMFANHNDTGSDAYKQAEATFNAAVAAKLLLLEREKAAMGKLGGLDDDGGAAKAAKAADTLLAQLERRLARIQAQNASGGATGFLDGIEERIKSISSKGPIAESTITKIKDAATGLDRESAIKSFNTGLAQMEVKLAKIKGAVEDTGTEDSYIAKLLAGKYGDVDFLTEAQVSKFKSMAKELTFEEANADAIEQAKKDNLKYVDWRIAQSLRLQHKMKESQQAITAGLMKESDKARAIYAQEVADYLEGLDNMALGDEERKAYLEQFYSWLEARSAQLVRDTETPMEQMARNWEDNVSAMEKASASWMDSFSSELTDLVVDGKADFQSLADSIIKDMIRISMQRALAGIFGANRPGVESPVADNNGFGPGGWQRGGGDEFANGGIMTKFGRAQLNAYSGGGVANSPQVAIFGEGSRPEAYVPLPDGKTIPVSMKGGGAGANVQVNVINQSGQDVDAQQGTPKFDGERMILDVVLKAAQRPGRFRDGLKGGLGR